MIDIKKLIGERGFVGKFEGVVPEEFVLVHEKTLEDLKDFECWKLWRNSEITIQELNKKNFQV